MTRRIAPVLGALALMLAACGGGGDEGGGEGADNPTSVSVEAGDERVAHPLAPGNRYRLTIQEDCEDYTVSITQDGGDYTYSVDNSPIRIVFVSDVPGGSFFIEQTNEACTDWSLEMVRVSGT